MAVLCYVATPVPLEKVDAERTLMVLPVITPLSSRVASFNNLFIILEIVSNIFSNILLPLYWAYLGRPRYIGLKI